MEMITLNGIWQLLGRRQEGEPSAELTLTAKVPGCVQLDLSKAGYLPADLFMGENILETQKYEDYEWWYTRTFTAPTTPEDYILASQISQAEAKKYFIERMRVGRPKKTGIIWWNLLDGWPQMSNAVVDYFFTKKLAYEYIKQSQAPFCIAAIPHLI